MSEFKFACPVCGQHITADSAASGTQLECPTCFRKIVVPQAGSGESKFILAAAQADKPRPTTLDSSSNLNVHRPRLPSAIPAIVLLVVMAGLAAGAWFAFGDKIKARLHASGSPASTTTTNTVKPKPPPPPRVVRPMPTNTFWTLQLSNAVVPEGTVVGSLRGSGFSSDRATLTGGNLFLRQPHSGMVDLGITIQLPVLQGEQWSGRAIELTPEQPTAVPRVVVQWRNDQDKTSRQSITNGYAMKLAFGQAAGGRISGKLYLALPDEAKSFVAGNFEAEIKKPAPPKPRAPKPGG